MVRSRTTLFQVEPFEGVSRMLVVAHRRYHAQDSPKGARWFVDKNRWRLAPGAFGARNQIVYLWPCALSEVRRPKGWTAGSRFPVPLTSCGWPRKRTHAVPGPDQPVRRMPFRARNSGFLEGFRHHLLLANAAPGCGQKFAKPTDEVRVGPNDTFHELTKLRRWRLEVACSGSRRRFVSCAPPNHGQLVDERGLCAGWPP